MTPLAAKLFRMGDEEVQRALAPSQFFECTALVPMAIEMRIADGFKSPYSDMAQLPAPFTVIEAIMHGRRTMFTCREQEDGYIGTVCIIERDDDQIIQSWDGAFKPGTRSYRITGTDLSKKLEEAIVIGLFLVEKMLCIINQPGLVETRGRDTDKRVLRKAKVAALAAAPRWHQCRIRPGQHGDKSDGSPGTAREHQLHYVRKHFKPSLERWIDGYWRGNADLGLYLKHYAVDVPARAA